jgi:adenylate kinase family enzyme
MSEPKEPARHRFHVIGTAGAGKTTLARRLARKLDIPHVELDALHWGPDWTPAPLEFFRERAARALSGEAWVVDGNYSKVRDIVWARADTVVWLNYPLPVVLWRVTWRTLRRTLTRQELWGGNRESLRESLFGDSIIRYALQTHHRRQQEYPVLFQVPEHAHLRVVDLHSPREANRWLEEGELGG